MTLRPYFEFLFHEWSALYFFVFFCSSSSLHSLFLQSRSCYPLLLTNVALIAVEILSNCFANLAHESSEGLSAILHAQQMSNNIKAVSSTISSYGLVSFTLLFLYILGH